METNTPNPVAASFEDKKLSWWTKAGFSCYQLGNVADFMITTWLMYYYTTFFGMSIILTTMIFTIGKVISSVLSPVYGFISDRLYLTRFGRRFGRRKSLLLIGIPLKCISFVLLWVPGLSTFAYFTIFLLFHLTTPLLSTAYLTFMSEMTQDSKQRAQLAGINQAGGTISGIIASLLIIWLFKIFGEDKQSTYFISAMIYIAITLIFYIIFYFSVSERPYDVSTDLNIVESKSNEKTPTNPLKSLGEVFWNFISAMRLKSFAIYFGMYICEQMFRSLRGTINTYFIVFALLLTPTSVASSTTVGYVFGILFIIFFAWLTQKTNGSFTYRVAAYPAIVTLFVILVVAFVHPPHMVLWWIVLITCLNFGIAGVVNSTQYLFSFIPDVDEMVTSKRREGQYAGVQSTLDLLFSTLESLAIGLILQAVHFASKATTQPPLVVHTLIYLYTIVPIVLLLMGAICSHFLKLDDQHHKILLNEVIRLRSGGSMKDVTPETRETVESLTGFKYENCWGNNRLIDFSRKSDSIVEVS